MPANTSTPQPNTSILQTSATSQPQRVIIIGAGYGGMALANLLARDGIAVEVFEKNETPGGRIATVRQDGFTFEIGPSWYLMPEVFERYYALFGKSAAKELKLMRFSPGYRAFFEQAPPIDIQGDLEKDRRSFEKLEPGSGDQLKHYVATSSLAYRTATQHFLSTNFDKFSEFLKTDILRAAPSMVQLTFQPLHRYVSSHFHDSRLQKLLEYHMVFLGSSPFQAPALYTLMSHLDFKSGVFYPKDGMDSLVTSMRALGESNPQAPHYTFRAPVQKILVKNGKAVGVRLEDGSRHYADVVVANSDLHFSETQLLEPRYQSYPETYWKKRQPGPSALLVSLGVKGSLPQLLHHNLFLVDDWQGNFEAIYRTRRTPKQASFYVCNPTKTNPSVAPAGHENLFILIPLAAGISYSDKTIDKLVQDAIKWLGKATNQPDIAQRIVTKHIFQPADFKSQYNAWACNAFGGESHLLKQSVIFRTGNKSRKVRNLYYVGAGTLPGIGLPMCLMSAELAYRHITGSRHV